MRRSIGHLKTTGRAGECAVTDEPPKVPQVNLPHAAVEPTDEALKARRAMDVQGAREKWDGRLKKKLEKTEGYLILAWRDGGWLRT